MVRCHLFTILKLDQNVRLLNGWDPILDAILSLYFSPFKIFVNLIFLFLTGGGYESHGRGRGRGGGGGGYAQEDSNGYGGK